MKCYNSLRKTENVRLKNFLDLFLQHSLDDGFN